MDIEFRDPPKTTRNRTRGKYTAIAEALRAKPGEWAFIGRMNNGIASAIRKGQLVGFGEGDFEATTRDTDPSGKADVYARYVGQ